MNTPPDSTPWLIGCGAQPALADDAATGLTLPPPSLLGFKAHNLARMAALGLPVPPAFVLSTACCTRQQELGWGDWAKALVSLEAACDMRFGDPRRPLLVSVRSGAPVSMPGMMETLLNVGLCESTLHGLIRCTGNPRLAWDAYRRLIAGFGEVVLGVPAAAFEADLATVSGALNERELDFGQLRVLALRHLVTVEQHTGQPFPQDPRIQLEAAIRAVFASWWSDKAVAYRRMQGLDDHMGTAVTVQRMVFGNAGGTSGAGVGFTRHPSTGEARPWFDFLFNAQGEDVVSGRRNARDCAALAQYAPEVWAGLLDATRQLEAAFGDMQDIEFTVEEGQLYLLQTRSGKRTAQAAARIALDLFDAGLISREEALQRTADLDEQSLSTTHLLGPDAAAAAGTAPAAAPQPLAEGVSACAGVVIGEIALDATRARERASTGASVILLRQDAQTSDVAALEVVCGLLTQRGARTSHAAVVARQLGKVCLVGCEALQIDLPGRRITLAGQPLAEGDILTLDGNSGAIHRGALLTCRQAPADLLQRLQTLRSAPTEPVCSADWQASARKAWPQEDRP